MAALLFGAYFGYSFFLVMGISMDLQEATSRLKTDVDNMRARKSEPFTEDDIKELVLGYADIPGISVTPEDIIVIDVPALSPEGKKLEKGAIGIWSYRGRTQDILGFEGKFKIKAGIYSSVYEHARYMKLER